MIPIFYRSYPYAPKATMISALSYVGMFLTAVGGIVCFALSRENWLLIPLGILLIGAAVFFGIVSFGHKYTDRLAQEETDRNIRTKASFARNYCRAHPEAYEWLQAQNPDFAMKYVRNEEGKIVKRK